METDLLIAVAIAVPFVLFWWWLNSAPLAGLAIGLPVGAAFAVSARLFPGIDWASIAGAFGFIVALLLLLFMIGLVYGA